MHGVRWQPGTLSYAQCAMLLLLLTLLGLVIGSGAWISALGLRMPT
ncbi:MAG TPA: hypothetical protein VNV87_19720 [Acidimicrobiales bacterium]|nr:hypothetical protein [Acidimicrobiales bacterium]